MLKIDNNKCTVCGICLQNCPFGALLIDNCQLMVNDNCTLCGACVSVCRFNALQIVRNATPTKELEDYHDIFVWIELEQSADRPQPKKVALELLSKARGLADALNERVTAVVLTGQADTDWSSLGQYGADRVICCKHSLLSEFSTDGFTNVLCALISSKKPAVVLYGATSHGRELAPRIAARLRLGLTADCTELEIDHERQLVQTRPAFGGNIMASIITPFSRPQTATVRPNVFPIPPIQAGKLADLEFFSVKLHPSAIRTRVINKMVDVGPKPVRIEDARVVVSGGRGCQKADNLILLQKLAEQLGGVLAGSRAIVEQGWLPHTRQVGQSGTTVGPDLYIAAGISGAIQHIVGMSSSKKVIVINKDSEAPIFKTADLGIVGDALTILPHLIRIIEQQSDKRNIKIRH